jgi:hypothetical protein
MYHKVVKRDVLRVTCGNIGMVCAMVGWHGLCVELRLIICDKKLLSLGAFSFGHAVF